MTEWSAIRQVSCLHKIVVLYFFHNVKDRNTTSPLRSKAMSKARRLPPTMQRYDIKRDVGGNWRYLAGIGENDRSDEAFLSRPPYT